jgi:hypothetical protein
MRAQNLFVQAGRDQALASLGDSTVDMPAAHNRRFPEDRWYICETYGDWLTKFSALRRALQHRDRWMEQSMRSRVEGSNSHGAEATGVRDDAVLAANKTMELMMSQLRSRDHVMNRATFEEHTGLQWQ